MIETVFKSCQYAILLTVLLTGCAAPSSRFKNDCDELFVNVRGSEAALLFPADFQDIYLTVHRGDAEFAKENIEDADMFYQLAIGKIELLERRHAEEIKRRENAARVELEKREREAAEALRAQQEMERKLAEEAVAAAARIRKIELEKADIRKRVERVRYEKEVPLVAIHTVKRGETLPQIAALAEVYGDASLWPLLYKANRDQISNPAVLWPGQALRIPRNHDRNELNEARKFSSERNIR
jgi:nucleoid-associated protein YgaU